MENRRAVGAAARFDDNPTRLQASGALQIAFKKLNLLERTQPICKARFFLFSILSCRVMNRVHAVGR